MFFFYDPLRTASHILAESTEPTLREEREIKTILEDANSPVTNKYIEGLYNSVITKSHIDFDDIPNSKGNITAYSGYTNLIQVLENLERLASDNKVNDALDCVQTVKEAIANMRSLAPSYEQGFRAHNEYVMLEYNTFVYTIVQATSSILYSFVDYIKRPQQQTLSIVVKNTRYHANLYYIEQLKKFNTINNTMQYKTFLDTMVSKTKDGFLGATELVGLATVVAVALAIIPITRELVYQYYNSMSNLADCLAQQAYFLEMNKTVIEANTEFTQKKKDRILLRQSKIRDICLKASAKLRVDHVKAISTTKAAIQNDNKRLTVDNIKKEVQDRPLTLL